MYAAQLEVKTVPDDLHQTQKTEKYVWPNLTQKLNSNRMLCVGWITPLVLDWIRSNRRELTDEP